MVYFGDSLDLIRDNISAFGKIKTFTVDGWKKDYIEVFWTGLNNIESLTLNTTVVLQYLHPKETIKEIYLKQRILLDVVNLAPNLKIFSTPHLENLNLNRLVNLEELTLFDLPADGAILQYIFENMRLKMFSCGGMSLIKEWIKQEPKHLVTGIECINSTIELLRRFPCKKLLIEVGVEYNDFISFSDRFIFFRHLHADILSPGTKSTRKYNSFFECKNISV